MARRDTGTRAGGKKSSTATRITPPALEIRALDALADAVDAWARLDTPAGHRMIELLAAARIAHDAGRLDLVDGLVSWGRRRAFGTIDGTQSEAARAFVKWIGLTPVGIDALRSRTPRETFVRMAGPWLAWMGRPLVAGHPYTPGAAERMVELIDVAAHRGDVDEHAIAVAVLRGWGLSLADARSRMRGARGTRRR